MLGQVIGVEAGALVELDQPQPLVELPAEIATGAVHVVEDAELHAFPRFAPMLQGLHEESICAWGCGFSQTEARGLPEHGIAPGNAPGRHSRGSPGSVRTAERPSPPSRWSKFPITRRRGRGMSVRFRPSAGTSAPLLLPAGRRPQRQLCRWAIPDFGAITRHSSFNFDERASPWIRGPRAAHEGKWRRALSRPMARAGQTRTATMQLHHRLAFVVQVGAPSPTSSTPFWQDSTSLHGRFDRHVASAGPAAATASSTRREADSAGDLIVWVLPGQLLAPPSHRRSRHFDPTAGANRITCLVGDEPGAAADRPDLSGRLTCC